MINFHHLVNTMCRCFGNEFEVTLLVKCSLLIIMCDIASFELNKFCLTLFNYIHIFIFQMRKISDSFSSFWEYYLSMLLKWIWGTSCLIPWCCDAFYIFVAYLLIVHNLPRILQPCCFHLHHLPLAIIVVAAAYIPSNNLATCARNSRLSPR